MAAHYESLRLKHYDGTAPSSGPTPEGAKVSVSRGRGFFIRIRNLEAAGGNNLEISFDNGRHWYPILPEEEFRENAAFHFFRVRGVGGTADWSALISEG